MNLTSYYDEQAANKFLKLEHVPNLSFLIYRDIPALLQKYLTQGKALDFGCGPGISTRFLSGLGFDVIGVDINKEMLKAAFTKPDGIPFAWIEHGKLPFRDDHFALVMSIMVLLEMPNMLRMEEALNEISRVLRPGGFFLTVVGSELFPKYTWINKNPSDTERNQNLSSGDPFSTYSKTTGITFKDYFYTDEDYRSVFSKCNLALVQSHKAFGRTEDGMPWDLEKSFNPYTHYLCQKHQ